MRNFAIGFVVGGLLGVVGMNLHAQETSGRKHWYSGSDLMQADPSVRVGYAAAVLGMTDDVIEIADQEGPARTLTAMRNINKCLSKRAGGPLNQFTQFAESLWRGRATSAANALLVHGCE